MIGPLAKRSTTWGRQWPALADGDVAIHDDWLAFRTSTRLDPKFVTYLLPDGALYRDDWPATSRSAKVKRISSVDWYKC